jgi:hypothetical protein
MKLTKENLQFIDTYLENSDVVYVDIRLEMVDHIATGVEEKMRSEQIDFYDAFKNYMAHNKREIIKNNKDWNSFSWLEIKKFLLFLLNPVILLIGFLIYLIYKNININNYFGKDFTFNNLIFLGILFIVLFQIFYFHVYLKKRFYAIEKTGHVLIVIYYFKLFLVSNFIVEGKNNISSFVFLFITIGYVLYFIREIKKINRHKYNLVK